MADPADDWTVTPRPCEGCGATVRLPRNYPDRVICLTCAAGLLPPDARRAMEDLCEWFGLMKP
jgi:hypothetical protein